MHFDLKIRGAMAGNRHLRDSVFEGVSQHVRSLWTSDVVGTGVAGKHGGAGFDEYSDVRRSGPTVDDRCGIDERLESGEADLSVRWIRQSDISSAEDRDGTRNSNTHSEPSPSPAVSGTPPPKPSRPPAISRRQCKPSAPRNSQEER